MFPLIARPKRQMLPLLSLLAAGCAAAPSPGGPAAPPPATLMPAPEPAAAAPPPDGPATPPPADPSAPSGPPTEADLEAAQGLVRANQSYEVAVSKLEGRLGKAPRASGEQVFWYAPGREGDCVELSVRREGDVVGAVELTGYGVGVFVQGSEGKVRPMDYCER